MLLPLLPTCPGTERMVAKKQSKLIIDASKFN
jgi:hypothetical protein